MKKKKFVFCFMLLLVPGCNKFVLKDNDCFSITDNIHYYYLAHKNPRFWEIIEVFSDSCFYYLVEEKKGSPRLMGWGRFGVRKLNYDSTCVSFFFGLDMRDDTDFIYFKKDTLYRDKYRFNPADSSLLLKLNIAYFFRMKKNWGYPIEFSNFQPYLAESPKKFRERIDSIITRKEDRPSLLP